MKAVSYYRVSTTEQDLERQKSDIKEFCSRHQLKLVEEFEDKDSGFRLDRPDLLKMLRYLKEQEGIDFLIVSETSRLGRTHQVLSIVEELDKLNICLWIVKDNIRTLDENKQPNNSARLTLNILSGISTFEVDILKYRIKSGIRESRLKGNAAGSLNIPYGYKKVVLDKKTKLLTIDEEEAEIIRTIFNLYLDGKDGISYGTTRISGYLNDNKILTRLNKNLILGLSKTYNFKFNLNWVDGTIYSILKNRIYIGKRKHATNKLKNFKRKFEYEEFDHPDLRIISDEVFFKVQEKLKSNYNKQDKGKIYNYLLDNKKITCGVCGKSYFPHKRKNNKDNTYKCLSTRIKDLKCGNYGINIDKLDRLIQSAILHEHEELLLSNLENNNFKEQINSFNTEISELDEKRKDVKNEEHKILKLYLKGSISDEIYEIEYTRIKSSVSRIDSQLNLLKEKLNDIEQAYKESIDIGKLRYNFQRKNENLPKNIINKIITKITLTALELAPEQFKDVFEQVKNFSNKYSNTSDRIILVKIQSGVTYLYYLISQRSKWIFDFQDNSYKITDEFGFAGMRLKIPVKLIPDIRY
jgi:site-specific DNA recombinase